MNNSMDATIEEGTTTPGIRYQFSPDELRTLKECNRESFYYRCIPFSTFFGTGTYFAIKAGYLSSHSRWGHMPKIFAAVTIGYFLGKFSYQSKCIEKLMELPNSKLGDMLKKQRGRSIQEVITKEPLLQQQMGINPDSDEAETSAQFTDVGDTRPMTNFDNDSNIFGGIDYDTAGTTNETQMMNNDEIELLPDNKNKLTTYDELRQINRHSYEKQQQQHSSSSSSSSTSISGDGGNVSVGGMSSGGIAGGNKYQPLVGKKKNIYGDVWDDKTD